MFYFTVEKKRLRTYFYVSIKGFMYVDLLILQTMLDVTENILYELFLKILCVFHET